MLILTVNIRKVEEGCEIFSSTNWQVIGAVCICSCDDISGPASDGNHGHIVMNICVTRGFRLRALRETRSILGFKGTVH